MKFKGILMGPDQREYFASFYQNLFSETKQVRLLVPVVSTQRVYLLSNKPPQAFHKHLFYETA